MTGKPMTTGRHTSSRSNDSGRNRVPTATWRKSSRSGSSGDNCVEVIAVRH